MKESLISDEKKFLNNLFKNLIFEWTISATAVKKLLKVLAIETGSLMYFSSLVINESVSLFFLLHWYESFYTFPNLLYIFDVFIEEVCEILFFSPFEERR